MIIYQLTRPIAYLLIKDQSKYILDWIIPLIVTAVLTVGYFLLPIPKPLYGENGLLKELEGFLQILPGFYLAALAAIATFNKNDLDYRLPAPTPLIDVRVNGVEIPIQLTRRRMLSYLFGYLTFLSLALYIFTVFGSAISPSAHYLFKEYYLPAKAFFLAILILFFWQMIIVTVFGLYQLCDRIHLPDNQP